MTQAQKAVADKTNEIPVVIELLRHVVLEGRVVTMDALLTPRHIAQHIGDAGRSRGQNIFAERGNAYELSLAASEIAVPEGYAI